MGRSGDGASLATAQRDAGADGERGGDRGEPAGERGRVDPGAGRGWLRNACGCVVPASDDVGAAARRSRLEAGAGVGWWNGRAAAAGAATAPAARRTASGRNACKRIIGVLSLVVRDGPTSVPCTMTRAAFRVATLWQLDPCVLTRRRAGG